MDFRSGLVMNANPRRTFLLFPLILGLAVITGRASPSEPRIVIELEAKGNTLDGCTDCGCRLLGEIRPDGDNVWWSTFGLVRSNGAGGWEPVAPSSHCGEGRIAVDTGNFSEVIGLPYAVSHLAAEISALSADQVHLQAELKLDSFSGFDPDGDPKYESSVQTRSLRLTNEIETALPILIAGSDEKTAFGTHDFLLIIRATSLTTEPTSYGKISVSADVPGAKIFLDGGYVGRVAEGQPVSLRNVRTGIREVRVQDFSGRQASEELMVREDDTAQALLALLDLDSASGGKRNLVPIGRNPQGYEELWRSKDAAIMVRIPGGEFVSGSASGQDEANEQPQRKVNVPEFLIDKHEVTWRQYRKYLADSSAKPPRIPVWGTPDHYPVTFVLWKDAQDYCNWVGGRLPTETEWERAARGTDGRTYPWGDQWDPERCNSISGGTHSPENIGHFPDCLSPYGVLDMAGSVWEWCEEGYGESPGVPLKQNETSERIPDGRRIVRGGAWMSQPRWLQATYRHRVPATTGKADQGFRCVLPE